MAARTICSGTVLPLGLSGAGGRVGNSGGNAVIFDINPVSFDPAYAGIIQDGIGVTTVQKDGTGTTILSGANTSLGGTIINTGILEFATAASCCRRYGHTLGFVH